MENSKEGLIPKYIIEKVDGSTLDAEADYFVLRLDDKQKDKAHRKACLKALKVYADNIKATIPKLSEDLYERYQLAKV